MWYLDVRRDHDGSADSTLKIDDDLPLDKICLLGCSVGTGWGSAVNSAAVRPGHTAIITVGVIKPEHLGQAMASIRKAGTVVVTALGNIADTTPLPVSLADITFFRIITYT